VPRELITEKAERGELTVERRGFTRIFEPFPIKVKGVDEYGNDFNTEAMVDNLSASGLFIRLKQKVKPGAELSFIIQLSTIHSEKVPAPNLAARGIVRRVEPRPDGKIGLGVSFTQHRFI
jgi:hypothetical protein